MNPPYRSDMSQHTSLPGGSGYHAAPGHPEIAPPAPPNPYAPSQPQHQQHQPSTHQHHPQHHYELNHLPPVAAQTLPPPHHLNPSNHTTPQPTAPHPAHLAPTIPSQPHNTTPTISSQPHDNRPTPADQIPPDRTELETISLVLNGLKYTLHVRQQPKRARMCGYGDKDRRPITPPPCVRLTITNIKTGHNLTPSDVHSKSDFAFFVLNVDLWNEAGTQEVNLCRQPPSAAAAAAAHSVPVASSGYSYSYSGSSSAGLGPYPSNSYGSPVSSTSYPPDYQSQQSFSSVAHSYPHDGSFAPSQQYYPQRRQYGASEQNMTISPAQNLHEGGSSVAYVQDQYRGALNRNLIGSVSASAFHLHDPEGEEGMWFVLQDLSVRLEGAYRLKFSFINVGSPLLADDRTAPQNPSHSSSQVITNRVPILASCFSDKFNVYSAKKFPGVCESTVLSKTFATQGIKIPIRKDGNKGGDEDEGE